MAVFCPRQLLDAFHKANDENGQILIDEYVRGYKELTHFFDTLGSVFGYINSDILEKVAVLKFYRESEHEEHYRTVEGMMQYEVEKEFNVIEEQPSGSRTLLRLHRALAFASLFMKRLGVADRKDKCSDIAYNSYNETLAEFHPWLIRKGVGLATYTLGSCGSLIDNCRGEVPSPEAQTLLTEISEAMDIVYEKTQELYTKFDLHGLP